MSKKITIIIPSLNEPDDELYNTIKNIYETADNNLFDIIAIDDNSEEKYISDLSAFPDIKIVRNEKRMGVDYCRDLGAKTAVTDNLLFLDSHMRFFRNSNWLNIMVKSCEAEKDVIWCSTSLGLGYGTMDLSKHKGRYYAADILFIDKNADPKRFSRECLEPNWRGKEDKETYSVPCILGAVYFMTKKRFDFLHGFRGLKMWGSSEPFLSLKNFLCSGESKIHTGIEVGHRYRDNSPFSTGIHYLYYNKIYMCKTILPEDIGNKIMDCLPKNINFKNAMELIEKNKTEIEGEKNYYNGIFNKTIFDFCREFNVSI